jgi:hypothetical protein
MAGERFYLIFSEQPNKKIQINEPIDFGEVDFNCNQRENGWGRDVTLSGGQVKFRFTKYRHDSEFKKLLYYRHRYGFEADVKIIIVLSDGTEFKGEIDFATSETNDFDYFSCSVILESSLQIFRRRSETKVDLFSNVDINGEAIEPLVPQNMFLQAKPNSVLSEWKQTQMLDNGFVAEFPSNSTYAQINPAQDLLSFGIEDSYSFFNSVEANEGGFSDSSFKVFLAKNNYTNVLVNITDLLIHFTTDVDNGGNGYVDFSLNIYKGVDFSTAIKTQLLFVNKSENQTYDFSGGFTGVNIGEVLRDESVWIQFDVKLIQSNDIGTFDPRIELFLQISNMKMSISADSITYNSIVPSFRLIDVMKQVAKSTSGLEVYAPRYDLGGEFYDNVLTNGNLLRNVLDKPFYISWDDIEKSIIGEHNSDSEIQLDGRVFHGIYKDYHSNEECGFFDNTQFSGLVKKSNPRYSLNEFKFKNSKYQSLKEATEPNSESTIHGESTLTPFNKKVENGKEATIQWVRDAILLDVQQRLSTVVTEDTATQDDDTIFAIDTIATESDQQFTETTSLQHSYDNTYLSLRTNGAVNFLVLGIRNDTTFIIEYPDANFGTYTVFSVTNTEIKLLKTTSPPVSSSNDGLRPTKYTYEIKKETIPLTNRTNEGFSLILNLNSPDKYSNLRYSVERNIRNYWNQFLATVNLYWKDKPLKNTYYKNNGKCETEYNGLRLTEKEDFIPNDPIVAPDMYEDVIFANVEFKDFIALQNKTRALRGFVRTIDNNNRVLKLYPINMSYENKSRQLTMSGQEKFEKAYLSLVVESGLITINEETVLRKLTYEIVEEQQVVLFDLERQRLYNPVYWDKVSVNGVVFETIELLKNALDLL